MRRLKNRYIIGAAVLSLLLAVLFITVVVVMKPGEKRAALPSLAAHHAVRSGAVIAKVRSEDEKKAVLRWMSKCSDMPLNMVARIYDEAHKHRFPDLLIAIAKVESNFNPEAVSDAGAVGLMQVMGKTWMNELKDQGIIRNEDDLFSISKCMDASSYILNKYLEWKRNNLRDALLCYGGPDPGYARRILAALGQLEAVKEKSYAGLSRAEAPVPH